MGDIYKEFRKLNRNFGEDNEVWDNFYIQYKIDHKLESTNTNLDKPIEEKNSYDFLTENLVDTKVKINKVEESKIVETIQKKLEHKDRTEGIKFVETFHSVIGAVEETEKRNKSRKIINELVTQSHNNIDDCIKRLKEDSKDFENLEETLPEIENILTKLKTLEKLVIEKIEK